jgi:hypothetical protein
VFLGNAVGGAVFVGLAYHVAFFNTAARSGASSKVSGAQTPE